MRGKKSILGGRAAEYERLRKQLSNLPLLAQGSVFQIDPPAEAPRANTRYMWTRKLKGKTVTKALDQEQYAQFKEAIEANRKVEKLLACMRTITQNSIVNAVDKKPKQRSSKSS